MTPPADSQPSANDTYTSPLAARNASAEMLRLWSPRHKFNTWRRIWLAVAEAQYEVTKDWGSDESQRAPTVREGSSKREPLPHGHGSSGPLVTLEQVEELRAVVERGITDAEIARAGELERELRHDVMAHVHCLGEACPKAKGIIHLGCTSQDVVCNADLNIIQKSIPLICSKLQNVVYVLGACAQGHKDIPTLGFTHYQTAQPTTVGRRCANWAYDLIQSQNWWNGQPNTLTWPVKYRGLRGATGTQASFLELFDGNANCVDALEERFMRLFLNGPLTFGKPVEDDERGLQATYYHYTHRLTGQTYPRVVDTEILSSLASVAAVLHKIATDIRLLSNRKEIDEPFGDKQIGSSAMPYKRNPMRCERICGLTRFVMNLVGNAYDTAATQWLERTLDDSSNRRLSLPESFLALDGALDLMHNVASGLVVNEAMVRKNLMLELPFLATENILMEAVKAGGDRQDLHERIRVHAQEAGHRVKQLGLDNDLLDRLRGDPAFEAVKDRLTDGDLLDPMKYVGRSVEQTERFIAEVIEPLRERYKDELKAMGDSEPRV